MVTLGAAAPLRGAPTARSQRWPGCPWGGLVPAAAAPVVALVDGAVITGAEALLAGVVVTPGREAGVVAALLFLVPEPELQAVNNTVANKQDPNNLYMLDDFGKFIL